MSIEFLQQVAATPLPKSFTNPKDIDAVKILRQAGLVIAMLEGPPSHEARVVAITDKGNAELLRFHYPDPDRPDANATGSWLQLAAHRARSVLDKIAG